MTPSRSDDDKDTIESVRLLAYLSYGLIFVSAGTILALAYVSETFRGLFDFGSSLQDSIFTLGRLSLVVSVLLWIVLWISNTTHETDLWSRHLAIPFIERKSRLAMVLLAIALAVLLLVTYDILLFSAYFSVFLLLNYWAQWIANDYCRRALEQTRRGPDAAVHPEVLAAIEEYWLRRPQLARITTLMFVSLVAFAVAVFGRYAAGPNARAVEAGGYFLQVLNLMVAEIVNAVWRSRRDRQIKAAVGRE